MKPIINPDELPKMLRVGSSIEKCGFNKFLPKPFEKGELVKISTEQVPHPNCKLSLQDFKKNYVVVIRKDENGAWTIKNSLHWKFFVKIGKKDE